MAYIQNTLIFAALCILAGSVTQAFSAEHRPPHHNSHESSGDSSDSDGRPPHIPHGEPLDSSDAEWRPPHFNHEVPLDPSHPKARPPHIHGVAPHFPPGFIHRPPHHYSTEKAPRDSADEYRRPPHHSNEEAPLEPANADKKPPHHSNEAQPLEHSDADKRPPHIHDDDKSAPSHENRPPHIHEEASLVPHEAPFQYDIPDVVLITPGVFWTPCDIHAGPRVRCHNGLTKLICTRLGGFVLECPDESFCRNGLCSDVRDASK